MDGFDRIIRNAIWVIFAACAISLGVGMFIGYLVAKLIGH